MKRACKVVYEVLVANKTWEAFLGSQKIPTANLVTMSLQCYLATDFSLVEINS